MNKLTYLAAPYSHPDPQVREQRFRTVCQVTAVMFREGKIVFSPITHSHPLVEHGMPTSWEYWQTVDRLYLSRCDELVVLKLRGWEQSVGVQAEIEIARELGKPVRYLDLEAWKL